MTLLTIPRCRCGLLKVRSAHGTYYCPLCRPNTAPAKAAPEPPAAPPVEPPKPPTVAAEAKPGRREIIATRPYRPELGSGISVINPKRLRRGFLRPGESLYVFPIYSTPPILEDDDAA